MPDTPPPPVLSDVIDVGSWARFSPSLAIFIDEQIRFHRLPDDLDVDRGLAVRLVAPAPVITESDLLESEGRRSGLWSLRRKRSPRLPSPEAPGIVLMGKDDCVEMRAPALDTEGRVLLGDDACAQLTALGWARREDRLMRTVEDGRTAAEVVTRVLIEVLRVAHPADLSWLVLEQSC
ncbi:hypothetical protein [Actinomyces massiliensis]|jgi:hypothetical protein|uniref:TY-Chap domain-containing protein n=1 Tax=Actinomyces massiliensis TaxID=461393 RepID=UPI0028E543A1|nr:hypothetical protein [Actinomyces massiliensis]